MFNNQAIPRHPAYELDFSRWGYEETDMVSLYGLEAGQTYDQVNIGVGKIHTFTLPETITLTRHEAGWWLTIVDGPTYGPSAGDLGLIPYRDGYWNLGNRTFKHKPSNS